ncbi:molecular chaperone [Moellerella wisconsensis]|uniref:fimbrial biogenesis chaperone n=1 Tax=Moellerella wisconsensis TaxID=158849 RepID=UPI00307664EA
MKLKYFCMPFLSLLLFFSVYANSQGGIAVSTTRIIYNADKKEAAISISNRGIDNYYIIQSWIEDVAGKKVDDFILTPPLFKLNANKENMVRIINKTALPQDRETVFWLNMKAIPPIPKNGLQNGLQIAIKTKLKLFYRPKGLSGTPFESAKKIIWKESNGFLSIENNSPYNITIDNLLINNNKNSFSTMILAFSSENTSIKIKTGDNLAFKIVNDLGSKSEQITTSIK